MRSRLKIAGLLRNEGDTPEINITTAWTILSRLGYPSRYGGKAQDGSYEYMIINPESGDLIAKGKGLTLEYSMCEAALNARDRLASSPNCSELLERTNRKGH